MKFHENVKSVSPYGVPFFCNPEIRKESWFNLVISFHEDSKQISSSLFPRRLSSLSLLTSSHGWSISTCTALMEQCTASSITLSPTLMSVTSSQAQILSSQCTWATRWKYAGKVSLDSWVHFILELIVLMCTIINHCHSKLPQTFTYHHS